MRKDIYKKISEVLLEIDGGTAVRWVDLWNRNVEFMSEEEAWPMPAVFIEFMPITWHELKGGEEYRCEGQLRLHIVTQWNGSASSASALQDKALEVLDLSEKIQTALHWLNGDEWGALELIESDTKHDHEDVMENIEVYSYRGERQVRNG
jgi:hypothetical protein